ncbi:MAG: MMPL family transporter [Mariprofundaceae bacterium]|nr:MMPL family transporter [Mariprofundaceae bacterium]
MDKKLPTVDAFATAFAERILRHRLWVIAGSVIVAFAIFINAFSLQFSNNYRVFFSSDNPELTAFETFQATYTKNDNFLFVIEPSDGEVFTPETLAAVEELTAEAWKIPFSIRVDSITNFQNTSAVGDNLFVDDLVRDARTLTPTALAEKQAIALAEPLLRDQLLSRDAATTAVNVVLQYPEVSMTEVPTAAAAARALRDSIETKFPNLDISLTGVSMLNNSFAESGQADLGTLIPLMYLVLLLVTVVALRSISATAVTLGVIMLSTMVGMGGAGLMGVALTPISASAPTVIMTLAIADSIHILMSMRSFLREGMDKHRAIVEAIRVNFLAVGITSLTTIVGFLTLNFSDSPPFWHLGNITAIGIAAAWVFSITALPALMSLMPIKVRPVKTTGRSAMERFADWVIAWRRGLLATMTVLSLGFIAMIPQIEFNDKWVEYFDPRIEFRTESEQALKHFGMYPIEFSVPANDAGGVSEPEFLAKLDAFAEFLRAQPDVTHVYSLGDIMKRLNRNMNGDDPAFYKLPDRRDLAAQYLLLYELSLPFGLDLNDRINIDKSATRITATLGNTTTSGVKRFLAAADNWLAENAPDLRTPPTGAQVMFTYITDRNVQNMILGTIVAITAIALILIVALRDWKLGLLSMVPNGLPILITFGAWALIVGQVGFSVAAVASISLGIIVDDTVHFLTKYVRARRENGYSPEDAVRYAFRTVGAALVVNTLILVAGFLVLVTSTFKLNVDMGLLTAMAIVIALMLDFLLLPALLLSFSAGRASTPSPDSKGLTDVAAE